MNDDYLRGFREGQASVYELVDRAHRRRDCFGPKTSSPIDSFDARVWAEELRKAVGATDGRKIFAVSLELMEVWFANALMRGYDEHRRKIYPELKRMAEWAHLNLYGGEPAGWRALPDVAGVLSQLDNMLAGMGPKRPGTQAPEPPGVEHSPEPDSTDPERLRQSCVGAEDPVHRLKSVVGQLKIDFLRGLKLANERIGVLESKSGGDWSKRLNDLEVRTMGISAELPMWGRRIEELEKRLEDTHANLKAMQAGTERIEDESRPYEIASRLLALENWLGTKKYAPESDFASKTWVKLEQLANRLSKLEART
jgi:hypothetical protein